MSGRSLASNFRPNPVESEKYILPLNTLRSGWGAPFAPREPRALSHSRFFWTVTVYNKIKSKTFLQNTETLQNCVIYFLSTY